MGGAAISVLPDPMGADHLDCWTVLVNKPTKFSDEQCQELKQQFGTRWDEGSQTLQPIPSLMGSWPIVK